ncbi:MAG: M20/M25/M40 family metallo-hydrolase, partial [Acidobacteriota bacterium]
KATFDEKRPTQNVLAKISGTDKNLKNEYVIVGAHMDHLGIDMTGDVLNGADDNASGTAVVMEVARMMKLNKFKPKRTVVFALWAAEEMGLLGSKYYTENPVYPLDQTVAYINLDMEGHGTGKVNFRGVYYAPEIWDLLKARLPKELIDNVNPGRGGPGGSDHTYFLSSGVPGYFVATDGPHFKTNRVGDVIDLIKPEIMKKAADFVAAATEALSAEPKVPIMPRRRETYQWRYQTIVNYKTPPLERIIEEHKDVQDPDVDFQLASIAEKEGLSGDALRVEVLKSLLDGQEKLASTKGLALYGRTGQIMGGGMMAGRLPSKTTVLLGLRGIASVRDDLRFADVFSKQGVSFISLDQPEVLFRDKGLSDEGKKIIEGLGKANLLLIVKGLDSAQAKALLENAKKPVLVAMGSLPEKDVLERVKKTNSCLGLILGKDEDAASYFKKIDEAKKAVGTENISIVSQNCLWETSGKELMLNAIGELIKAKYESEDLMNLFSGSFMRTLSRARGDDRPSAF